MFELFPYMFQVHIPRYYEIRVRCWFLIAVACILRFQISQFAYRRLPCTACSESLNHSDKLRQGLELCTTGFHGSYPSHSVPIPFPFPAKLLYVLQSISKLTLCCKNRHIFLFLWITDTSADFHKILHSEEVFYNVFNFLHLALGLYN